MLFQPDDNSSGFNLEISDLKADMALEGPLGRRTLTLKYLKIKDFSCQISESLRLPEILPEAETPSFFARLLKLVFGLFLFRDIKFQSAELANGIIIAQLQGRTILIDRIQGGLGPDHLIDVSCDLLIRCPLRKMIFTAPKLHISTNQAVSLFDPVIEGLLTAQNATFHGPGIDVNTLDIRATLAYDHNHARLTFEPACLSSEEIILGHGSERESVSFDARLKTEGVFHLKKSRLDVPRFELTAGNTFKLAGKADARFYPQAGVEIEFLDSHVLPQKLVSFIPPDLRKRLPPVTITGPVGLQGKINCLQEHHKWLYNCDLEVLLEENHVSYTPSQMRLNGRITGNIKARGSLPDIEVSVCLKGDKILFSGKGVELKPSDLYLTFCGVHPEYLIKELSFRCPHAVVTMGDRDLKVNDIQVHMEKGRMHVQDMSLSLPEITLDSSLLRNLILSIKSLRKSFVFELRGKDVRIIESALALNLIPGEWQSSGRDSVQLRAVSNENGDVSFTSKFRFEELAFENQDSSCTGENISVNAEMNGNADLRHMRVAAGASLDVNAGEILYDRFYLDFSKNAFFSSAQGMYDSTERHLCILSAGLGLKDIMSLDVSGTLAFKSGDNILHLAVTVPETALVPAFDFLLLEPFGTEKPFLDTLEIGGTFFAYLDLDSRGADWVVRGRCIWQNGELSSRHNEWAFKGIDLALPFWYQTGESGGRGKTKKGSVSIRHMKLPPLPEQSLALQLDAGPNLLSVRSPTTVIIPGGHIRVGPLEARDIFSSRPSANTSLGINIVDINPLLSGIWHHPSIKGTAQGSLDPVHLQGHTCICHGEIKAKIFDGQIILYDLGASGLFSSSPVFRLSARLNDLSLAGLTAGTSFGKIEGSINGYIKDLEIAYGQPQRFDLLLETVKKKGVPQVISVTAVDNIAQIGGGQSPFVGLAGTFSAMFKQFSYSKIGVHASLENDLFSINGTIKEGGKEYLVKRSGFSGVDIVNQNPENRIRFKDMVKRVKRVTDHNNGPVIR